MYLPSLLFCLSSITSCSILSPDTSWICLICTPSNSRPKEWPTALSRSGSPAMFVYLSEVEEKLFADQAGAAGELGQLEDHELGGLDRGYADLADNLTCVD